MIVGNGLAAWIGDPAARDRTMAKAGEAGQALRALPGMVALDRQLQDAAAAGADGVLRAARSWLEDPANVDACVATLVEAAQADPFFRPPLRAVATGLHSGLVLVDRPELTILLATIAPDALAAKRTFAEGPSSISFGGRRALFHFIKAGGATLSFWEAPPCADDFSADDAAPCRLVARRLVADGETIEVDGRHQSFVIEHVVSDLVYLEAQTPLGAAPLLREYDSASGEFVGASSTDDIGSRTAMMLSLLREMDRGDAVPLFVAALRNPDFHARWHAIREFLALDAEAALPHLEAMAADDPHPEVREAARQTLAAFFASEAVDAQETEQCLA